MTDAIDHDALVKTTSVDDMADGQYCYQNRDYLRKLRDGDSEISGLCLCGGNYVGFPGDAEENYVPGSDKELGWLGYFVKKSTSMDYLGWTGQDIFDDCSTQAVEAFFKDLSKCTFFRTMSFLMCDMAHIVYKLGPCIKNNSVARLFLDLCHMDASEANYLFELLREMSSLEELGIECEGWQSEEYVLDDDIMAGCVPSLKSHTRMQEMTLCDMRMSTSSCNALSAVLPQMTGILSLHLGRNLINCECTEALVRGLGGCCRLEKLDLTDNEIGDNGLDALMRGLPASVHTLHLSQNNIAFARQQSPLRFDDLDLSENPISLDGLRKFADSLADPGCCVRKLRLMGLQNALADEGAAIIAAGLRSNRTVTHLGLTMDRDGLTRTALDAFSSTLCNTTSINDTYSSNHMLQQFIGYSKLSDDIEVMLALNSNQDKNLVAAEKILLSHRHLDVTPLIDGELGLLPFVIAWLERFALSRRVLKLSSIFQFVRTMPNEIVDGCMGTLKKKHKRLVAREND